jgi:glycosyltransferase involved in cell wall biosynthesis
MLFAPLLAGGVDEMIPLVSILVPCHNAEKFVAASIRSALEQTWQCKEIIVVDDDSTDSSWKILEHLTQPGIKTFRHQKGNASATRNRAFQESTGEFIKFFDADDLLEPKTIELQMARLAGSTTAVASAEWGRFYGDDISTFRLNPQSVWRDMNPLDWLVESWMDAHSMMQPGLFLMPRSVIEQSGLWDERLSLIDDCEFFARVLCHASEVRFTPGARLYYRSGIDGSLSGRKSRRAVESAFHSLLDGTAHLLARRQDRKAKLACANLLQDFIYTYYPGHTDLRRRMEERIKELGGSNLPPSGPPRFEQLRKLTGWKLARRVQRLAGH